MPSPIPVKTRLLAALLWCALAAAAVPAAAQTGWPNLNVRGFALRPLFAGDVLDTSVASMRNYDQNAFLMWDRDTSMERQRADFGGYSVYRSIGPDTANMVLLRRYVLRPARTFGNSVRNPDNGSTSRLWTFRDDRLPGVGLFIDPDSVLSFDRIPLFSGFRNGLPQFDTSYVRSTLAGPKNGFDYFYAVTICDTTENGEDLTPRGANMVGPVRPTGAPVKDDLDQVRVVPNPYTFRADWDVVGRRKIRFTNLPVHVKIEIYTADGALLRTLEHNSASDNGEDWDVKNGQGQEVGSGIYLYRLETLDGRGRSRVSRFTIIR
ncbi:MAG: hypothetical protein HZB25_02140 [Candidatus Eisenbacteria bacterium]|nr:hypothetical protein [Candidatus Eisenbacteria bacterium]